MPEGGFRVFRREWGGVPEDIRVSRVRVVGGGWG